MAVQQYRYLKPDRVTLDIEGILADAAIAPKGSVFLLHACAHNPTGTVVMASFNVQH